MNSLAELFPEGGYRFHLTLRRGEPADFFAPQDPDRTVLAERRRWLAGNPGRYAALLPEGVAGFHEFAGMCEGWGISDTGSVTLLGGALEPDFLLLSPDADGAFRLRGGALCFPTGWALEEKLGHTLEFIHGVVPGLNPVLGSQIQHFLARLKPGVAFLRQNWGLSGSPELNLHPARTVSALDLPVALDRIWLRVEHQALVALPQTGGVVFGIRIAHHRLDEATRDPLVREGLLRALTTMSAEVAAYKRLDRVSEAVGQLLRAK